MEPAALALQSLLATGFMSRAQLNEIILRLNEKHELTGDRALSLESVQAEAENVFRLLDMELRNVRNDYEDGERYLVIVDTDDFDEQVNRIVMPQHLALQLKKLVAELFEDSRLAGVDPETLSPREFSAKTELVSYLLEYQFLEKEDNRVFASTRLLYSLEPYIAEEYGEKTLFKCLGCREWLLKGRLCTNTACSARLHTRCYDAYFQSHGLAAGTCPLCSSEL